MDASFPYDCSLDNLLWDGSTLGGFAPDRTHYGVCADYNDKHTIDFYLHDNSTSIIGVSSYGGSYNLEFHQGNHYKYTMRSTNYFGHGYLIFLVKSASGHEVSFKIEW